MEIVPGIHRLEPYIGTKLVAHHLITGERSLLVDAGTPELARTALLPWLTEVLGDPARLDMLLVTHADVDHYGGLEVLRAACPRTLILAPQRDRRWIEQPEAIFAERYDAYHAEYGLTYTPEVIASLHAWHGQPVAVDLGLAGGEEIRCGEQLVLRVLHVPGHTPGHLMLWESRARVAIIGDALNGLTQVDREGNWTAPPPYTERDLYLGSTQTIASLAPDWLLTGHYPVMQGAEIHSFVQASRDFIARVDEVLEHLLREANEPLTLLRLSDLTNPLLGPFGFPPDLAFALEAHLTWFERIHKVQRLTTDGLASWTWIQV